MTVRLLPKRTAMQMVDLRDQPEAPYILSVVTDGGHRYTVYVDKYIVANGVIAFFVGSTLILALPVESMWTLVHASCIDLMDMEEVARATKADHDAREEMVKTLFPKEETDAQPTEGNGVVFPGETSTFPHRMYR